MSKAEELERIRAAADALARKRVNGPFDNHERHRYQELLAREDILFSELTYLSRRS